MSWESLKDNIFSKQQILENTQLQTAPDQKMLLSKGSDYSQSLKFQQCSLQEKLEKYPGSHNRLCGALLLRVTRPHQRQTKVLCKCCALGLPLEPTVSSVFSWSS